MSADENTTSPYGSSALEYQRLGYSPVPLPFGKKAPPLADWTGYAAPYASGADISEWVSNGHAGSNVGLRLPETVLGLDLDAYDGKPGLATMLAAEERLGNLPQSPRSTSRPNDPQSGIRFYTVPAGRRWADRLGHGVEVIHWGHRYAVVAPSLHPEGRQYAWQAPDGTAAGPPAVSDLPALPDAWVKDLNRGDITARSEKADLPASEVTAWLAALPAGEPCQHVVRLLERAQDALAPAASRHDIVRGLVLSMVRAGEQGHHGASTGLDTLQSLWQASLTQGKARTPDHGEWDRMLTGAVAMVHKNPTPESNRRCCSPAEQPPAGDVLQGDDEGPDAPVPGSTWQALDLGEVIAGLLSGTITRHAPSVGVRDDGAALFYPGKVNGVAGASGSGKTWTALVAATQELAAGHDVVYVDLEDDAAGVVGRLLDLGADPATVAARFHYVSPDESYTLVASRAALEALVRSAEPSLVVIDSTGESMALDAMKPNDDDDTARWFRRLPNGLARLGPAVLVLDHVVKADDGGLWPIGSQRKRAAINGAQYMQMTVRAFAKGQSGSAKVVCAKDRHGNYRPGQKVAELHVTPAPGVGVVAILLSPAEGVRESETFRPTSLMEKVSRALELVGPEGLSVRGLASHVTGKKDAVAQAVDVLADEGYLTRTTGPRNAIVHTTMGAYRQADDPRSDMRRSGGGQSTPASAPNRVSDCPPSLRAGDGGTVK